MANPVLNERSVERARSESSAGWASPTSADPWNPPINDGPISPYSGARDGAMTVRGTAWATASLFAVLLVSAGVGWGLVDADATGVTSFPGWLILPVLAGFGLVILSSFKPHLARFTAPAYAVLEGIVVGAISHAYDATYNGIVLQAVGATAGVFVVMLALYGLRIIRVTDRLRRTVIGATLGICVFYGISLLFSLFGATPTFFRDGSVLGIVISLVIAAVAAFNLALDFDMIDKSAQAGAPRSFEWFGALALTVTIVWLYLEMLRLIGQLRN
ncbi:MAG: Bax inhibitor-1/YccA family protein [Acidimicrobiia bacterium]